MPLALGPRRGLLAKLLAIAIVGALFTAARLPDASGEERARLAARFHFTSTELVPPAGLPTRQIREVNPSYQRIAAWISSVGAGIAMSDLDGNGRPDDLCYVDVRVDRAVVAPAPVDGAGNYQPFALDAAPLPYDPATMAPMGCLPGDLNEDGRMDLLVYYWGRTPVAFLALPGAPARGAYRPVEAVPTLPDPGGAYRGERWYTNAAALADLDGDGHDDLLVGNYFPDGSLVLDATDRSGSVAMQHSMSRAANGGHNRLLRWVTATTGSAPSVLYDDVEGVLDERVSRGWTLGIGAADLDGDLLPEVYVANDFGPDHLLHNRSTPGRIRLEPLVGRRTPDMPASKVLSNDSFKGMGIDFGDLNGDGLLDMVVSNITTPFALQESNFAFVSTGDVGAMRRGVAPYVDRSEPLGLSRSGWGWDIRLADFDNDGTLEALQATGFVAGDVDRWPELQQLAMGNDLLLANPSMWPRFAAGDDIAGHQRNPFWVRDGAGRYVNIGDELGLDRGTPARGLALGDADHDGALDLAVANQWAASVFHHNDAPTRNGHLGLRLLRPVDGGGTRPLIGAQATVWTAAGRRLVAQVDGGSGHSGKRSPELLFGLGAEGAAGDRPVRVELRWRDAAGTPRQQTLELAPGWHSLILDDVAREVAG